MGIETESSGVPRITKRDDEEVVKEEEGTKVALKSGESDSSKYRGTYYSWKPGRASVCTRADEILPCRVASSCEKLKFDSVTFLTGDLSPLPATERAIK